MNWNRVPHVPNKEHQMPTSKKQPASAAAGKAAAKSAARNTASGPARAQGADGDALAARAAG